LESWRRETVDMAGAFRESEKTNRTHHLTAPAVMPRISWRENKA